MNKQEMNVILRNMNKTKTGKVVLNYSYVPTGNLPDSAKGLVDGQKWIESDIAEDFFNNLSKESFGKICKGTFDYEVRYNGTMQLVLQGLTCDNKTIF